MRVDYAYLMASVFLLLIWLLIYWTKPRSRKKMLLVSLATAPLGITEPLFVPAYWLPFTLFDLARKTRFDLESFLFSFAVGGIASVLYETIRGERRQKVSAHERQQNRHQLHLFALLSPVVSFLFLYLLTPINPIYSAILALFVGAVATWYCRPDLVRAMLTGSMVFLATYFGVFLLAVVWPFPGYVEAVWNLPAISGILIAGVPIEELLFAGSLGAMWSSVYEHFSWYKFS